MKPNADLYSDYLISSFSQTSATGLARLVDNSFSHDQVTDFLTAADFDEKRLWKEVKPFVRKIQQADGAIVVDDSIAHKPHSRVNGLVCYHYDHTSNQVVKGINFVSALYCASGVRVPIGIKAVVKTGYCDLAERKEEWKSDTTKNEMFRSLIRQAFLNQVPFRLVMADSWYTNADNINAVLAMDKHYLGAIKSNATVALSAQDKAHGKFVAINTLHLQPGMLLKVYLRSVEKPLLLGKDIFINKDGSEGELVLLSTDTSMTYQQLITTYQKRWEVEEFHKSLKQNTSLEKSPASGIKAQTTHLFCSVLAFVKLERLKVVEHMNHFALKAKLYLCAIQAAFQQLERYKLDLQ